MNEGDELFKTVVKDTYHLEKSIECKFKLLRKSYNIFLIILSVVEFIACNALLGDWFNKKILLTKDRPYYSPTNSGCN